MLINNQSLERQELKYLIKPVTVVVVVVVVRPMGSEAAAFESFAAKTGPTMAFTAEPT